MENQVAMRILGKNAPISCLLKEPGGQTKGALLRVGAREGKWELELSAQQERENIFLINKMELHVSPVLRRYPD